MSFKSKLVFGLGFLFLVIFALAFYSSFGIQALSRSADKILKDNYNSLVYCMNMLLALDDMRMSSSGNGVGQSLPFAASQSTFEKNLAAEKGNITEAQERGYVEKLNKDYGSFLALCLQARKGRGEPSSDLLPAYLNARRVIVSINEINMEAIQRKSLATRNESRSMIAAIAAAGAACVVLAFFYFWLFPAYVSNSLSQLEDRMHRLLEGIHINLETRSRDEAVILSQSIALLEKRFLVDRN
jgi:hypothetical protein